MNKINKLMVVIDGTAQSIIASFYSIYLAKLLDAQLYAIYVINEKALNELLKVHIFTEEEKMDYEKEMHQDAEKYLNQVQLKAEAKGVNVKKIIKKGIVHIEVIKTAEEEGIDAIVIGELRKMISVREASYDEMERIMRVSRCSIIIAKDKEKVEMLYKNI